MKKEMQGLNPKSTMVEIRISTTEWRQSNQCGPHSTLAENSLTLQQRFFIYILRSLKEDKGRAGLENYSNTW